MNNRQANIICAVLIVLGIIGLMVIWLLIRSLYHPAPPQFCWGSYDYCRRR